MKQRGNSVVWRCIFCDCQLMNWWRKTILWYLIWFNHNQLTFFLRWRRLSLTWHPRMATVHELDGRFTFRIPKIYGGLMIKSTLTYLANTRLLNVWTNGKWFRRNYVQIVSNCVENPWEFRSVDYLGQWRHVLCGLMHSERGNYCPRIFI